MALAHLCISSARSVNNSVVKLLGSYSLVCRVERGSTKLRRGWRLEIVETGPSVLLRQRDAEPFVLQEALVGTYRASSFSPSGPFIVLVDSATTQVHVRSET